MNRVRVDMFKKGDPSSIWEMNGDSIQQSLRQNVNWFLP